MKIEKAWYAWVIAVRWAKKDGRTHEQLKLFSNTQTLVYWKKPIQLVSVLHSDMCISQIWHHCGSSSPGKNFSDKYWWNSDKFVLRGMAYVRFSLTQICPTWHGICQDYSDSNPSYVGWHMSDLFWHKSILRGMAHDSPGARASGRARQTMRLAGRSAICGTCAATRHIVSFKWRHAPWWLGCDTKKRNIKTKLYLFLYSLYKLD